VAKKDQEGFINGTVAGKGFCYFILSWLKNPEFDIFKILVEHWRLKRICNGEYEHKLYD
jgi:hypothetical protein